MRIQKKERERKTWNRYIGIYCQFEILYFRFFFNQSMKANRKTSNNIISHHIISLDWFMIPFKYRINFTYYFTTLDFFLYRVKQTTN